MKLSDYVIDFLAKKGIKHSFIVSGGAVVHLIDSVRKNPTMNYVCAQHEQNGAAAADMYARVTRNIGLVMTTSGPGATNILTSVCTAYFDSIPLFCITGQVARFRLKKNKEIRQRGFQETDIESIFESVTKYVKLIRDPLMIRYELEKAIYFATEKRPGPVVLDIPDDLQRVEIDPTKLASFTPPKEEKTFSDEEIKKMYEMINLSKRPVILFGAGVHIAKCEDSAIEFAKKLKIPVLLTWAAKDLLSEEDELNVGVFGVCGPRYSNFAVQNSDLVIAMGIRLCQMNTGGKQNLFAPKAKKIMIDVDKEELEKFDKDTFTIDLPINADLNDIFSTSEKLFSNNIKPNFHEWTKQILIWKKKYPICPDKYYKIENEVSPYVFLNELSKVCLDDDIILADTGANVSWTGQAFKMKKNQRIFSAWNHTPMGYSVPASVGAAFATDSRVICIIGDGGLMMCLEELGTIRRHNLNVYIFLFNNKGHGIQKQTMDTWLDSQYSAVNVSSGLFFPDYKKIAEAFDIDYVFIEDHSQINSKLNEVFCKKGPVFCDVNIIEDQKIEPMLKFGAGLEDLDPKLPQDEIKENMLENLEQIKN